MFDLNDNGISSQTAERGIASYRLSLLVNNFHVGVVFFSPPIFCGRDIRRKEGLSFVGEGGGLSNETYPIFIQAKQGWKKTIESSEWLGR